VKSQSLDTGILGTVSDPSGAAIAAVTVTITQTATGVAHTVTTGSDGKYEVRYLLPGEYTVEVHATGFATERRPGIVLQIGQQARIDFALQLANVQETIEVQAATPLLQTENATLGGVVSPERIVNLYATLRAIQSPPQTIAASAISSDESHGASDNAGSPIEIAPRPPITTAPSFPITITPARAGSAVHRPQRSNGAARTSVFCQEYQLPNAAV
jgi:hypothetical protein